MGGTNFTLRGLLDDPTATVTAQITDTNGITVQADGLVERNGLLWVEDLPLGPGTNMLTLTMSNAAGLSNMVTLSIVQSDVIITIDDLSTTDLNQPSIYVSGSVSDSSYDVYVNGMEAISDQTDVSQAKFLNPTFDTGAISLGTPPDFRGF